MRILPILHKTAIVLALTLTACSDDDGASTSGIIDPVETETNVADPTEDQMEVTYSGKTAVIDYDFDDMGLAIFSRMANRTGELTDDVEAVLLSPKALKSDFAIDEAVQLVRLYEQGATIILVEPSDENWQKLGVLLEKAEAEMTADSTITINVHRLVDRWEMLHAQGTQSSAFGKQDAVALRLDDTYIISDLQEQADSCYKAAGETSQDVTDYSYGKSADLLMEWLKKGSQNQAKLAYGKTAAMAATRASSGSQSLTDLAQAQLVTVQMTAGPSRVLGKSMPYEFQYEIYSVYNFESDEEYYLIRQHINFHASRLNCTSNKDDQWTKVSPTKTVKLDQAGETEDVKWVFGPYMRKSIVESTLVNTGGSETVYMMDPKPVSTSGSSSTMSGFSWSVSGVVAWNYATNTPEGGVSASLTWESSYSITRPQLTYLRECNNLTAKWTMEGKKSETYRTWYEFWTGWACHHTAIADFQAGDWDTDLTWYYRIEHPDKARRYTLNVYDYTEIAELLYDADNLELAVHPWHHHTVELDPPNRFMQKWMLMCSDQRLQSNVSKQLPDIWSDTYTTTAQKEEGLEENMTISFNRIKNAVKGIAPTLVRQGYTGHYTFSVSKVGSTDSFMTFTLDNGVVE